MGITGTNIPSAAAASAWRAPGNVHLVGGSEPFGVSSPMEASVAEATNFFGPATPVFRVTDVAASVAYYTQALGFEVRFQWSDDFASVARGHCQIFLTGDNQSQPRMWVWIGVQDVRALHAQYEASGAQVRNPPNNFEWGLEMQVEDLDGNVLRIGSDREKDQPLGVWKDADGARWRQLGDQKYERVE